MLNVVLSNVSKQTSEDLRAVQTTLGSSDVEETLFLFEERL